MAERMLIIDDDDVILESCRRIFSATGFQVTCTTSPPEGLRLIVDSFFDVILCDWKMPGFDGMDVLGELESRSPRSAVVMISGYPTPARETEALKRGAMDYVAKPFTPGEIVETVRKAIRSKALKENGPPGDSQ
jgi:DNA-binding NtrC family response regulator